MRHALLLAVGLLVLSSCGPALLSLGFSGSVAPDAVDDARAQAQRSPAQRAASDVDDQAAEADETDGDPEAAAVADAGDEPSAWDQALTAAHEQIDRLVAEGPQRTQPQPGDSPLELAAQLEMAERIVRDDDADEDVWAAAGHLQQVAVRELVRRPEWGDEVRQAMSDHLVGFVDLHVEAGRDLADMHPTPDYEPDEWPDPPPWRIVEPPPMDELLGYYRESADAVGIEWPYLAAIHLVETRMGRIDGTSWAGAQGPMQFMPGTWDWVGAGDVNDPRDSIMAAGRLLRENGAPADMDRAIWGYNNDVRYARAVSSYAHAMKVEPRMLRAYFNWQVYIPSADGSRLLPIGFDER